MSDILAVGMGVLSYTVFRKGLGSTLNAMVVSWGPVVNVFSDYRLLDELKKQLQKRETPRNHQNSSAPSPSVFGPADSRATFATKDQVTLDLGSGED